MINGWGWGDIIPWPDDIPYTGGLGVRFNCQELLYDGMHSNLQAFLVINDEQGLFDPDELEQRDP